MPLATALFNDSMDLIRWEMEMVMRSRLSSVLLARSEADNARME